MIRFMPTLYLILILLMGQNSVAAKQCVHIFTPIPMTAEIQKHIDLTIADLAKMRTSLDLKKVQGSNTIEFTALSADYISKEKEFLAYLEQNNFMTAQELFEKIKSQVQQSTIINKKKDQEERNRIQNDLIRMQNGGIDGSVMIFNRVHPGSFQMGPDGKKEEVHISRSFEMMATATTQVMWKKIIELASKKQTFDHPLKPEPSGFKGATHPVESVSYIDIVHWIKHLNQLAEAGEPALVEIIPGFKKGDKFRLPTSAEWEFVARNQGQHNDRLPPDMQLEEHAWLTTNSSPLQTQPVAKKMPLVVDRRPYYDLYGNVWEFVALNTQDLPKKGVDPKMQYGSSPRPARGGSWGNTQEELGAASLIITGPYRVAKNIGFRLVREVQP